MRLSKPFLIIALLILQLGPAKAEQFRSVDQLMSYDGLDFSDGYNQSIVLQRCAGIFGALTKIWPIEDKQRKESLFNDSMGLLTHAVSLMAKKRGRSINDEVVTNEVSKAYSIYVNIYYDSMEKNQIMTGSLFSDLVAKDLEICSNFTN